MFANVKVSLAKVENVVKPPQNPVISSIRKLLEGTRFANKPIQKHPRMLIRNVANGKGNGSILTIKVDVRNLNILPTAPPSPTSNICLIIFQN